MHNKLIIFSGTSGSGKTTLARSIMDNELVSFTTRAKRKGEVNGRDYIFITEEEFNILKTNSGLVESTCYGGNYYGLTLNELESKLAEGSCFFIADVVGMKQMKKMYDNVVTIFIFCEREDCESNMRERGDSEENIKKRLSTHEEEVENLYLYDHVVVNRRNELDVTIENVKEIVFGDEL